MFSPAHPHTHRVIRHDHPDTTLSQQVLQCWAGMTEHPHLSIPISHLAFGILQKIHGQPPAAVAAAAAVPPPLLWSSFAMLSPLPLLMIPIRISCVVPAVLQASSPRLSGLVLDRQTSSAPSLYLMNILQTEDGRDNQRPQQHAVRAQNQHALSGLEASYTAPKGGP